MPTDTSIPWGKLTAEGISIRPATAQDIPEILEIYTHHVLNGVATFEYEPPSEAEMASRQAKVLSAGMPYIIAVQEDKILGYAYAGKHHDRIGYAHSVDDSIWLSPGATGRGVGKALLHELIEQCTKGGWRQMISVIADPEGAGAASVSIHKKAGFRLVGVFDEVGWKKERWIDVAHLQRQLGSGSDEPPSRPIQ